MGHEDAVNGWRIRRLADGSFGIFFKSRGPLAEFPTRREAFRAAVDLGCVVDMAGDPPRRQ